MSETQAGEYIVGTTVKDPERVEKRRGEIIDVAVKIFSEKGYHATTTKEIADAAGMNVGTMFQYVKTKQDILYLGCCHIHLLVEQALYAVTTENLDPMNGIVKDITALYEIVDQVSDYVVLMYQETASLDKEARRSFFQREQRLRNHLVKQIQKGIDAGVFKVSQESVLLIAEDILVQSHMWAFRRWSLSKEFTLEKYIATRIKLVETLLT